MMKKTICKILMYIFFCVFICLIYYRFKEVMYIPLSLIGACTVGLLIPRIIDWLFDSEVAENE